MLAAAVPLCSAEMTAEKGTTCELFPHSQPACHLHVLQIKAHKLQELVSSGVPEKYTAELARMRIKSAK